jgi:hypothetical protein
VVTSRLPSLENRMLVTPSGWPLSVCSAVGLGLGVGPTDHTWIVPCSSAVASLVLSLEKAMHQMEDVCAMPGMGMGWPVAVSNMITTPLRQVATTIRRPSGLSAQG